MIEAVALALGGALAVVCVVFAARPFLRAAGPADAVQDAPPLDSERLRLEEERDRALAALKELEFDHRTGKISDVDYRDLVGPLPREAADLLRALDRLDGRPAGAPVGTAAARPAREGVRDRPTLPRY